MSKSAIKHNPQIVSTTVVASTKWLSLQTLAYEDEQGNSRLWDMATRTTKQKHCADAVVIIPLLRQKGVPGVETLLVEQFRPPVGTSTIEFPAGIIDVNESLESAALRELREETGFIGEKCTIPPIVSREVCMSPGLCDETVHIVMVEVDLSNPYNINPKQELDAGEFCTIKRLPLQKGLKDILDNGTSLPIEGLYMFALGLELGESFN